MKNITKYLILCFMFIFFGCAGKEYPADLSGDIIPINVDDRYKNIIEQQDGKIDAPQTQEIVDADFDEE
ncbi:MAG: hypothetical protein LBT96_05320 [Campylobacteraceae bacterium]|nr:hypothetical protein [Campylobacteraceae bacterium]